MVGTVIEHHTKIDDRESGEIAARGGVADSFFHGRNVILRNRAAKNIVDELELAAARQRFHPDLAVAVLPVATGLFFVTSLHVGLPADRLAIRNLGRLQNDFGVIALLQL